MATNKTIDKGYLNQYIPQQFAYLLKDKHFYYKGVKLKSDYAIHMIHEFIMKYFRNKDEISGKIIKISLWSLLMKDKFGWRYNYYINYLKDKGLIKLSSEYFNGGKSPKTKSRVYELLHKSSTKIIIVKVTDKIILKKNTVEYLKKSFLAYTKSPIPEQIREKLANDLYDIELNYTESNNYLNGLKINNQIEYKKLQRNVMSITQIKDNNLFFKLDEYGRMHTNFTILKREIRKKYLTIDGEQLMELDICNSQPLFLAVLMKRLMVIKDFIKPDVTKYVNLVKNGLIYEELIHNGVVEDRDEAKIMMYRVLFGKNGNTTIYNKSFYNIFPNVFNFIKDYKDSRKDYKSVSHILQKLESEFIFNNVISHIMALNPKIKIFTVHDSICFPEKYKKEVTEIFEFFRSNLLE